MDVKPVDNKIFTAFFEDVPANRERIAETMFVIAHLAVSRYRLDESDLEDCVSAATVKLLQKIDAYRPRRGGAFQFFFTVANNAVRDGLREKQRRVCMNRLQRRQTRITNVGGSVAAYVLNHSTYGTPADDRIAEAV